MLTPAFGWSLVVAGETIVVLFFLVSWSEAANPVFQQTQLGLLTVLGGLGWVVVFLRPQVLPAILVAAPLPLLASIAVTAAFSPYPTLSWTTAWQCAAYTGILWLLCMQAGNPLGRRNLLAAMGITSTVVITWYLVSVGTAWREWVGFGLPIRSVPLRPLGGGGLILTPLWMADAVVLTAPPVSAALWTAGRKISASALVVTAFTAVAISGTRAVLLFGVLTALAAAVVVIRQRGGVLAGLVAAIAVAISAIVGLGIVLGSGRQFDEGRVSAFTSAIDGFISSPLVGTGPGTYGVFRMDDSVDRLSRLAFSDANNVILTVASDSGLVGLVGLATAVGIFCIAIARSWRSDPGGRWVIAGALFGVAVFVGHALADSVFVLIGLVVLMLAAVSLAGTNAAIVEPRQSPRPRALRAALVAGMIVIAISSVYLIRYETTFRLLGTSEEASKASPERALAAARQATQDSPDLVPAWWVRMVAADSAGEAAEGIDAAERITALEGFGQEWISLAILEARAGHTIEARAALDRAVSHPPLDPMVEVNASILLGDLGANQEADAAGRRLLSIQPDIEPVLASGPPGLANRIALLRRPVALESLSSGDASSAFVIALSGEDRDLANLLLTEVARVAPAESRTWNQIVEAWFGDEAARQAYDLGSQSSATVEGLRWSWRLATRACDATGAARWDRSLALATGIRPVVPTAIGVAPGYQVRNLPQRYPDAPWRMDFPRRPYVSGVWTFASGQPACVAAGG